MIESVEMSFIMKSSCALPDLACSAFFLNQFFDAVENVIIMDCLDVF